MTRWPAHKHIPVLATTVVCVLLYVIAGVRYRADNFFSTGVLVNLFSEQAILGLAALGETFVILAGGIDLSVGAVIGLTSVVVATLIQTYEVHPLLAMLLGLLLGAVLGGGHGVLIHFFRLPPFLVTLAGMFLARGVAFVINLAALSIDDPLYVGVADFGLNVFPVTAIVLIAAVLVAMYAAHYTRFGRAVYALGGSEPSALLMGLPVGRTKIGVYALSGFCAAVAGVLYTLYTGSGKASAGETLELDAIAAVVIGGTLLSGGVGYVFGTLVGVLIYGIIQTAVVFEGTLSSWWTRIVIGLLLLAFILLQKLVQRRASAARH